MTDAAPPEQMQGRNSVTLKRRQWTAAMLMLVLMSALMTTHTIQSPRGSTVTRPLLQTLRPPSVLQEPGAARNISHTHGSTYPRGDCATECSVDVSSRMAHCAAEPGSGIPATRCATVLDEVSTCPTLRYPDAFTTEAYCMPRFTADCAHPDNFGCSKRCVLYLIITHQCVTDAYDMAAGTFKPDCVACNMCWDKTGLQRKAAQEAPYALVWARGPSGALFENHWLVLPKQACSGIESMTPGCTDDSGEYIWNNAYYEAQRLGFNYSGGEPTWALWLNAPNRRGVHQMHIHIAHFEAKRSAPDVQPASWLVRRVAAAFNVSTQASAPTRILGEGYYNPWEFRDTPLRRPPKDWARAYAVFVPSDKPEEDLGVTIKPFQLARHISAASDLPSHGYGIFIMPRAFGIRASGILVAAVWSTSDSEQLDETELPGDPIRYSHTCHQYIGTGGTDELHHASIL